jgi:hypothetical protein
VQATEVRYSSFGEFWPFYVSQHRDRRNRNMHFVGTTIANICILLLVLTQSLVFVPIGLVGSYGFAWAGHFFFEKNKPATFTYPVMSLFGDFKMYWLMWQGKMGAEVARLPA